MPQPFYFYTPFVQAMATNSDINIKNKKASFEYELVDTYDAGIQLTGAEIKSIRAGKASIVEAFCFFKNEELWIKGMHVAQYDAASYNNVSSTRDRKLLLKRQELDKLGKKLKDKGFTIVPLRIYIAQSGYAKVKIALARGKKIHDKRESLKEKDAKRSMDRAMKR